MLENCDTIFGGFGLRKLKWKHVDGLVDDLWLFGVERVTSLPVAEGQAGALPNLLKVDAQSKLLLMMSNNI